MKEYQDLKTKLKNFNPKIKKVFGISNAKDDSSYCSRIHFQHRGQEGWEYHLMKSLFF